MAYSPSNPYASYASPLQATGGSNWRRQQDIANMVTQAGVWEANNAANQRASAATAKANDAQAQAEANKKEAYGLARGRVSDLRGDSADQMVLQALMQRSGQNAGPYDATTIGALTTGANEQAAAAARQAMAQLSKSGLSPGDPAYQAAMQEINARRQAAGQAANLNINQQANVANYGARGQSLGQLGSFNQMRNAGITEAERYLGGMLASEQFVKPEGEIGAGGFQYPAISVGAGARRPQTQAFTGSPYAMPRGGNTLGGAASDARRQQYAAQQAAKPAVAKNVAKPQATPYNPANGRVF